MKTKLAALAVIASLALAGCSAGNQSAEGAPSATSTPSASLSAEVAASTATPAETKTAEATKSASPRQAWADSMINLFLNGNSKSSFDKFNEDLPHHYITEWHEESKGVLSVTVGGGKWASADLDNLGNTIMFTAGNETPGLKEVHVSSTSGETGNATRDNLQDF